MAKLLGSSDRTKKSPALMTLFELMGRRWAMRIVWELRDGPLTFRALQTACDEISPTVCNARLGELGQALLIVSTTEGYALTALGESLLNAFAPLAAWTSQWARALCKAGVDA